MGSDKPKKSCFNCTKRRIVCDLTPSKCKKCEKKGLECPGYGVRYRFTNGQTVSLSEIGPSEGSSAAAAPSGGHQNILKWVDNSKRVKKRRGFDVGGTSLNTGQSTAPTDSARGQSDFETTPAQGQKDADGNRSSAVAVQTSSLVVTVVPADVLQTHHEQRSLTVSHEVESSSSPDREAVVEITRKDWPPPTTAFPTGMLNLRPLLSNRDPQIRLLFDHFSAYVSPVMLMYDDRANGYRHQILPLAHSDPVVERAVCVAAAFHLSSTMPQLRLPAEEGRAAIIKKLSSMSFDLSDATWATILVLIVAELITGHEHILTLYKILVAFLEARSQAMGPTGLAGGSPLGEFLYYQSRLISFFAYPILGESSKALTDISHIFKDPLEVLEKDAPRQHMSLDFLVTTDEAQASNLTLVDSRTQLYIDIVREATEIYLLRVKAPDNSSSISASSQPRTHSGTTRAASDGTDSRLASIRCLFEKVNPSAPGSHTMVWPAFVAAAESQQNDDRMFFTAVLQRIWDSTGYANVLKGLDALPEIWEQQKRGRNWTSMLSTLKTVVM
ncbi:hypothetical protein N0V93_008078 [Gnomoniopsis smithogilvyi]|uniref:Zn(2)-C6 fungal-type domain-containing protein n=1 Tax=Gnomoniopsis smithogilvyi TaxID=1191159 RepID=A0A9W8YMJ0_9PEZI|nr:hypothetical protein N0V93_008078 [Gnomoniopsis smithogilvyi]